MSKGIQLTQKSWNWWNGQNETVEQQIWRVRITAIIFGLAHLSNDDPSLIQVSMSTFGGLTFGYCKESTGSVAPSILLHSINNGFVDYCIANKITNSTFLVSYLTFKISSYILFAPGALDQVKSSLKCIKDAAEYEVQQASSLYGRLSFLVVGTHSFA